MGTKNNPGAFDCYANAHPDEPMFILLGRDRHAPLLVRQWAELRQAAGEDIQKVVEARQCADAMDGWRVALQRARVFAVVKRLIVEQANPVLCEGEPADVVTLETPYRGAPLWLDPLDTVEVEVGLERAFGIPIEDGDTDAVTTVEALVAYVNERISAQERA